MGLSQKQIQDIILLAFPDLTKAEKKEVVLKIAISHPESRFLPDVMTGDYLWIEIPKESRGGRVSPVGDYQIKLFKDGYFQVSTWSDVIVRHKNPLAINRIIADNFEKEDE